MYHTCALKESRNRIRSGAPKSVKSLPRITDARHADFSLQCKFNDIQIKFVGVEYFIDDEATHGSSQPFAHSVGDFGPEQRLLENVPDFFMSTTSVLNG